MNVARVITELGGTARVICPAGGFSGALLDDLLKRGGIDHTIVPIRGNTRISFTVYERKTGLEYRFIPNGPKISADELEACLDAIRQSDFEYFVASGSVPLGAPTDVLAQIAEIVRDKGGKFILDSSGAGLSVTLERVPVYMVKPSVGELEALKGRRLDDELTREAVTDLVRRGRAEIVAVTMGAAGAIVATKDGVLRMRAPRVQAYSAVGAGDSFVGAMTLALAQGRTTEDALTFAIAAGAASVLTPGTRLCIAADVMRIYDEIRSGSMGRLLEHLG